MTQRLLSSIIIGLTFILSIMFSKLFFSLIMLFVAYFMLCEWYNLTYASKKDMLIGLIAIPLATASVLLTNKAVPSIITLVYFIIMWSTDTWAMIGGKMIGGYKLAPRISPNKTWSGLLSGVIMAGLVVTGVDYLFKLSNYHSYFASHVAFFFALKIAILCQISDLFVSIFKRKYNIKDSGNIIPGHGGMLDRFDSMILSAPVMFLMLSYN